MFDLGYKFRFVRAGWGVDTDGNGWDVRGTQPTDGIEQWMI